MPIITIEEDDHDDEVARFLSEADIPDVTSNATISVQTSGHSSSDLSHCQFEKDDDDDEEEHRDAFDNHASDQLNASLHNSLSSSNFRGMDTSGKCGSQLVMHDEDDGKSASANDGTESLGSTFELCSIASHADPLSLSISRSKKLSIDRSIGNSTSSRNRYMANKRTSSGLNRSIGSSTSSNRKVACSTMNQSTHSTGSKLPDIQVVPKTESIDKKYFVDYSREIGRGTKTIVRKCIERNTGNRYAVKSVRRTDVEEYQHMRTEANLLTALNHPSIIKIYDTYEDEKFLHMVVEICKGGELYDHVVSPPKSKKNGADALNCRSEEVAAVIVRRVVDAVAYLHEHNIVHRDLKVSPSNCFFDTPCKNDDR